MRLKPRELLMVFAGLWRSVILRTRTRGVEWHTKPHLKCKGACVFFYLETLKLEDGFVGASRRHPNLDFWAHESMGRDAVGGSLLLFQTSGRVQHIVAKLFAVRLRGGLGHRQIRRESDQEGDRDELGGRRVFGFRHAKIHVVAEVEGRV